jgi:hypothetical protein
MGERNLKKKLLLSVMALTLLLTSCAQPPARPIRASATPTTVATEIEPSPTAVPTIAPTEAIGNEEYLEVFEAVWNTVDRTYFDPDFGGLDWDAVHDDYEPLIAAAEDDETLYQLLNQMLWELNVSHTGVGPADMWPSIEPVAFAEGEIGIDVRLLDDRAVITRVEAESPAEGAGLRPGFVIQSIDGVSIEQIIADAQGHLSPPYNEQGRIDGLTRCLLSLIYGDPETCVTLACLDENDETMHRAHPSPMDGAHDGDPLAACLPGVRERTFGKWHWLYSFQYVPSEFDPGHGRGRCNAAGCFRDDHRLAR